MKKSTAKKISIWIIVYVVIRILLYPFCGPIGLGVWSMLKINNYVYQTYGHVYFKPTATYLFLDSGDDPTYLLGDGRTNFVYYPSENGITDRQQSNLNMQYFIKNIKEFNRAHDVTIMPNNTTNTFYWIMANGRYGKDELDYRQIVHLDLDVSNDGRSNMIETDRVAVAASEAVGFLGDEYRINALKVSCRIGSNNYLIDIDAPKGQRLTDFSPRALKEHISLYFPP